VQICYTAIVSTAERFLVCKLTRPELKFISKTVATVDNLCMVDTGPRKVRNAF